ncbi:MAG TPA: phosphoribosylanthranilate isomerase [Acidobacteriaceae bacterium]|jgi:phosphoribosylanthranilate isomerase|nr:phosphoribosylanthranilate isomerase [Acidobacteriaceae bacterium]
MFVKICANTNLADAQMAAELGADAVGFVFAPSKRRVSVEQVAEITPHLPGSVLTVGVFATREAKAIVDAVGGSGLGGVQLHSSPDAALLEELNCGFEGRVRLIQTVSYAIDAEDREAADEQFVAALQTAVSAPAVWAVLLDAARGGVSGGLGARFDWEHAAGLVRQVYAEAGENGGNLPKLIVAGGLRAENVREAIGALHPWGVDVASGVESVPGKKDPERMRLFLAAARESL